MGEVGSGRVVKLAAVSTGVGSKYRLASLM